MKNLLKINILLIVLSIFAFANEGEKESWGIKGNFKNWGAIAGVSTSHIESADTSVMAFPIIDYPLLKYQGVQRDFDLTDKLFVTPGVNYVAKFAFDNKDLSGKYKNLKDRDGGFETGVALGYKNQNYVLNLGMRADISDNSDGVRYYSGIELNQVVKQFIFINYKLNYNYYNSKYADYYFGISEEESINASVDEYHPDGFGSIEAGVSVMLPLSMNFAILLNTGIEYLEEEADSDILADRMTKNAGLGFIWMPGN